MEKRIIVRGLLAGAVGGVLSFVFARIFVEPVVARAIAYEDGLGEMHDGAPGAGAHEHGVELFSRGVQANVGMGFGVLAFSVAMGVLFAVVYCVAYGRVGNISPASGRYPHPRLLSVLLAAGMFVALYLVPLLKYPPNPPAVSLDETIRQRTLLYVLMVVLSAALLVGAVWFGRRLAARFGGWSATLMAAGAYVVAIAIVMLVLPTIDETPAAFPADDLYEFRLYSLGTQLVLWATIALVFAPMAARLLGERNATERAASLSA